MSAATRIGQRLAVVLSGAACLLLLATPIAGTSKKFFPDDPMAREPETQDASGAQSRDIDLYWDLTYNLFAHPGDHTPNVHAQNINSIDEVPDSSWFTNRIHAHPMSVEAITRGPLTDPGPATGQWTVIREKRSGFAPGFTARDARGVTWFISFDARGFPDAATGAILVANKLFWAMGYWQVENHLTTITSEQVIIGEGVTVTPPSGHRRPMRRSDLDRVFDRAHRGADGSYRAVAARLLPGKVIQGFMYHGTRSDDPNDLVPHEHRRELRALKVFGAWTNLVDMKAGNTLDTIIQEGNKGIVRHYLQDVGSTFGTGANGLREVDEGWEYLYEGGKLLKRLVSLGFYIQPWQTVPYEDYEEIGRFEGEAFDPPAWKPRVPTAAFLCAGADDNFWAARRVMAFSDDLIRAAVKTGAYKNPDAEKHLADVLIQRRDKIGRAYLPAVNPLVDFALDANGTLTFENAAVAWRVAEAPGRGYTASWAVFDNGTGQATPIGAPTAAMSNHLNAPATLPSADGVFVRVQVSAVDPPHPLWSQPVTVYFQRTANNWKLVGLERLP